MKLPRRQFLHLAAGTAAALVASRMASAQAYPARPITLIVPFPPGGAPDVAARVVADHMSRTLGQQVLVRNISGAGGTVGSTRAMRANPDGYTILMGQMGTHAASVALYPNLAYRPDVDFEPIGILEVKPTLVPFSGGAPAMNALVGGQVDYVCADIVTGGSYLESGRIKVYAVASAARNPAIPNVPTSAEAGLPEFQMSAWNGLFAPKATPKSILDKLVDALDKALDDDATRKRMLVLGCDIPDKSKRGPELFLALVKSEIARWSPIIKAANVKMD